MFQRLLSRLTGAALAMTVATACSGMHQGALPNVPQNSVPDSAAGAAPITVPLADIVPHGGASTAGPTVMFVGNLCQASHINAFPISANGNLAPSWSITNAQLNGSTGLFVIGARLWAAEVEDGKLLGFNVKASGGGAPAVSIYGTNLNSAPSESWAPTDVVQDPVSHDLFVTDHYNRIVVLAGNANGNAHPLRVISGALTKLNNPQSIALAPHNRIAVANTTGNSIEFFDESASGNHGPATRLHGIHTGLNAPDGLAYFNGQLYVSNAGGSITVYGTGASNDAAPIRTITGNLTKLYDPAQIAFDASGYLYVTNQANAASGIAKVTVFPPGATGNYAPLRTITGSQTGFDCPEGLALAHVSELYVPGSYPYYTSAVGAFQTTAIGYAYWLTLLYGAPAMHFAQAVAFDSYGNEYVADAGANAVYRYPPGSDAGTAPASTISGGMTGLHAPDGIGIDASDNIYVSNANASVTVYPYAASGNFAPARTIAGASTHISGAAQQIVVEPAGDFWVVSAGGNNIQHFAANATGNVSSTQEIVGSSTGMSSPIALAVDSQGIYEADQAGTVINVFPLTAHGNVAPTRIIQGTGNFNSPRGLATDAAGEVYLSDCNQNAVYVYAGNASGPAIPLRELGGADHRFSCPQKPTVF